MITCATMCNGLSDICTRTAAKTGVGRTLVLALTACTYQIALALGTGGTTALVGIQNTFTCGGIDVIVVDALQEFAGTL